MTFEIDLNPHSFVVFMTIAAGVSYIFFNSRGGFGVIKLMTLLFFIVPFAMIGNSLGHGLDILVGAIIGFGVARGTHRLVSLESLKNVYRQWRFQRSQNNLEEDRLDTADEGSSDASDWVFKERVQQANQQRESNSSGAQKDSINNGSVEDQIHSDFSRSKQEINNRLTVKSELELAYELIGIELGSNEQIAKKAYRRLISRYHEDKLNNLTPEARARDSEIGKRINVAWGLIKNNRGWR